MKYDILFGQPGGFPLTQDTLSMMQESTKALYGLGEALCNAQRQRYLILQGCEESGGAVSGGIIVYDGEILPFAGGTKQLRVTIQEAKNPLTYEDGTRKDAYVTRTVTFTTDTKGILWSQFKRYAPVESLFYDYVVDSDEKLVGLHNNSSARNVLIKKGTWRASQSITLHPACRRITGEEESNLVITIPGGTGSADSPVYALGRNPQSGTQIILENVNISAYGTQATTHLAGFYGLKNLRGCIADISRDHTIFQHVTNAAFHTCEDLIGCSSRNNLYTDGSVSGEEFSIYNYLHCKRLTNCKGETYVENEGSVVSNCAVEIFVNCAELSNCSAYASSDMGYCAVWGYTGCTNLVNCYANVWGGVGGKVISFHSSTNLVNCTADNKTTSNTLYSFDQCSIVFNCTARGVGSNAKGFYMCDRVWFCRANQQAYVDSVSSTSRTQTDYACDNSLNGGWNMTEANL